MAKRAASVNSCSVFRSNCISERPYLFRALLGWRRRIVRKLLLLLGRALHADVTKQQAWNNRGLRQSSQRVVDVKIVTGCHNLRAQATVVQLIEDRAPHQLTAAIGMNEVEQPRNIPA